MATCFESTEVSKIRHSIHPGRAISRLTLLAFGLSLFPLAHAKGGDPINSSNKDVQRVARMIDQHIRSKLEAADAIPSDHCDDAEFCRRVYLSIGGRIPRVSEILDFTEDRSEDKRQKLVDRMLASNDYVRNYATVWRRVFLPEVTADIRIRFAGESFETWMRQQLLEEQTRFDEIARSILSAPIRPGLSGGRTSPEGFFESKENKAENIAAATSRMLLGIRLECAQCHEHPFDKWSQEQFWELAAFFAQAQGPRNNLLSLIQSSLDRRKIQIPGTEKVVSAAFLDGSSPVRKEGENARQALADWITSKDNPYFAKATANRIWAQLFGVGIVDPVDDFHDANQPSHPELLNELARELANHDFDLKFLIRAIAASETFQRSSRTTHESQNDPRLFARMLPKPMSADQLTNSLSIALGAPELRNRRSLINTGGAVGELQDLFDDTGAPADQSSTILQALTMMNGSLLARATQSKTSQTLSAVLDAPWLDTRGKIDTLFLATLSRKPTKTEYERFSKYVESQKAGAKRAKAFGDVFWVLLNSSEFLLND